MYTISHLVVFSLIRLVGQTCWEEAVNVPGVRLSHTLGEMPAYVGATFLEYDADTGRTNFPNYWWELLPPGVEMAQARVTDDDFVTLRFCNVRAAPSVETTLYVTLTAHQHLYYSDADGEPIPPPDPRPNPHPIAPPVDEPLQQSVCLKAYPEQQDRLAWRQRLRRAKRLGPQHYDFELAAACAALG